MTDAQSECVIFATRIFNAYRRMCTCDNGTGCGTFAEQDMHATTIIQTMDGIAENHSAEWFGSIDRYLESEGVNRPDCKAWYGVAQQWRRKRAQAMPKQERYSEGL